MPARVLSTHAWSKEGECPAPWSQRVCASVARSTARVSTGQRVSLNSVEQAAKEARNGQTYWAYEHLSQVQHGCTRLQPCVHAADGAR